MRIRPPQPHDWRELAENMRETDRLECEYMTGNAYVKAISDAMMMSTLAWSVRCGGVLQGMFGVAPYPNLPHAGSPWLLCANRWHPDFKRGLVGLSPSFIEEMNGHYAILRNFVWNKNTIAKRWLRAMGFSLVETPTSFNGQPFIEFIRLRNDGYVRTTGSRCTSAYRCNPGRLWSSRRERSRRPTGSSVQPAL